MALEWPGLIVKITLIEEIEWQNLFCSEKYINLPSNRNGPLESPAWRFVPIRLSLCVYVSHLAAHFDSLGGTLSKCLLQKASSKEPLCSPRCDSHFRLQSTIEIEKVFNENP